MATKLKKKTSSKKASSKKVAKKASSKKKAAKSSVKKKKTTRKASSKATSKRTSTKKKATTKKAARRTPTKKASSKKKAAKKKTTKKKTTKKRKSLRPVIKRKKITKKKTVMRTQVKTNLEVGDIAVYPAHGVGRIERVENKEISGAILTFYIMRILDSDMTVMIPKTAIKTAGIREIITKSQVAKVFKIFEDQDVVIDTTTWNRRYREYMEKIKTGSVYEIAEVMRDLYVLKKTKTLSFGERKMLDTARSLLVKELSMAKGCSEEEIENKIQAYFSE
jgi:CarD family transcriptional regulator